LLPESLTLRSPGLRSYALGLVPLAAVVVHSYQAFAAHREAAAIAPLFGIAVLFGVAAARRSPSRAIAPVWMLLGGALAPFFATKSELPWLPLALAPLLPVAFGSGRLLAATVAVEVVALVLALHAVGRPVSELLSGASPLDAVGFLAALALLRDALDRRAATDRTREELLHETSASVTELRNAKETAEALLATACEDREKLERNIRRINESTSDFVSIVNRRGDYVYVSPGFARVTGRSIEEFVGQPAASFLPPEDAKRFIEHYRKNGDAPATIIHRFRVAKDRYRWCESTISTYAEAGEKHHLVIGRDVTERVELEVQLRHAQRMEGIGRLAGGIAHDFNNLAMAIRSYSELAAERVAPDHPIYEDLMEIRRATERAGSLTRQLLAFARKQVLTAARRSPKAIVADMERLLLRVLPANVALRHAPGQSPGEVLVDAAQIEQVLMNLAINGADAMPNGGELTFEVNDELLRTVDADALELPPGPYVAFSVRDTGVGMSPELQRRAFEPFFTTKPVGKGTGLGLPTCEGIARQHGGALRVASTVGAGTTFTLLLPLAPGDAEPPRKATPAARPAVAPRRSTGIRPTILLVEDEHAVRRAFTRQLRDAGYTVVAAASGEEALGHIDANDFALVVTDVMMPGIGGRGVVEHVQARRPGARVVYMSGYVDDEVLRREGIPADASFLQKPFPVADLLKTIEVLLA
jgi:PAS domain S-box-containing protein